MRKKIVEDYLVLQIPLTSDKEYGGALTRDEVEAFKREAYREGVPYTVMLVRTLRDEISDFQREQILNLEWWR